VSRCVYIRVLQHRLIPDKRKETKTNAGAYSPPNSCMPSRAKMSMKRNRRNNSEMMDRMLLSSEMTRLRSDGQYLQTTGRVNVSNIL